MNLPPQRILEWKAELQVRLEQKHRNESRIRELQEILKVFAK